MRARITFSKQGALCYTSHLELHKLWERAARRAGLSLEYSKGFHPQPKISLASALPLGYSSRAEVLDLRLTVHEPIESIVTRLQGALPAGLVVLHAEVVIDTRPPLQTQLVAAEFEVTFEESPGHHELERRVASLLGTPSILRERRGKAYDLRPLVFALKCTTLPGSGDGSGTVGPQLCMQLAAQESATGRPEEVLDTMGLQINHVRIERTALFFRAEPDPAKASPSR